MVLTLLLKWRLGAAIKILIKSLINNLIITVAIINIIIIHYIVMVRILKSIVAITITIHRKINVHPRIAVFIKPVGVIVVIIELLIFLLTFKVTPLNFDNISETFFLFRHFLLAFLIMVNNAFHHFAFFIFTQNVLHQIQIIFLTHELSDKVTNLLRVINCRGSIMRDSFSQCFHYYLQSVGLQRSKYGRPRLY